MVNFNFFAASHFHVRSASHPRPGNTVHLATATHPLRRDFYLAPPLLYIRGAPVNPLTGDAHRRFHRSTFIDSINFQTLTQVLGVGLPALMTRWE